LAILGKAAPCTDRQLLNCGLGGLKLAFDVNLCEGMSSSRRGSEELEVFSVRASTPQFKQQLFIKVITALDNLAPERTRVRSHRGHAKGP